MPSSWPLTARGVHIERLGQWYAGGVVGGVVFTGPAGVGKTRLGEEALRAAQGLPTARVVGHPATQSFPLGAVAHLLSADFARDVGIGDDVRATLFHRARVALTDLAGEHRLILLVDDVDQLDETSLALLLPLTIDRTIFLVATIRSGRPLPAVIASLVKDGHVVLESLPPLSRDEVVTLLHRVLDGPIETRSVDRLATVSDGNLQVLQELVRGAQAKGVMRLEDGVWRLAEMPTAGALEELVASHLADLDADGRRTLEVLAVAGSVGLADVEAFSVRSVVDDLDERGFVNVTVDGRRTKVALAHPVYGEVIRSRMTVLRERSIQRQLAERLEAHGVRRGEDVTAEAKWRLEAGGDIDVSVLLGAGRMAVAGRDTALAARFAAAAAARGRGHEAAGIAVEAAMLDADPDGVERAVAAVWDDPSLQDGHRAHLARRLASARFGRGDLAAALAAVDDADGRLTEPTAVAAVRAQRALLLATTGRPHEALAAVADVDDLEAVDDARVRTELASARSVACVSIGRFDDALAAARLGAQAQQQLPAWLARRGMAGHLVNEAHAYAYGGRFHEARILVQQALAPAQAAGAVAAEVWFQLALGEIERDCGYGRAAIGHFEAAVRLARPAGQQAALVWAWVGVAQGHLLLGDAASAAEALDEADAAGDSPVATSWSTRERTRAWLLAANGDLSGARRLLSDVADTVRVDGIWVFEAALRHDLARFGDPGAVTDRLDELARLVEGPLVHAMAAHARAAAGGDLEGYERVIAEFAAMDCVVFAAEVATATAELHRRRGNERAGAAALVRAAHFIERSGGARTPGLLRGSGVAPLTARERQVAVLAAAGVPSKEIATRLLVSRRTIDTHLDRAYRKLGVSRREQLAEALDPPGVGTQSG